MGMAMEGEVSEEVVERKSKAGEGREPKDSRRRDGTEERWTATNGDYVTPEASRSSGSRFSRFVWLAKLTIVVM